MTNEPQTGPWLETGHVDDISNRLQAAYHKSPHPTTGLVYVAAVGMIDWLITSAAGIPEIDRLACVREVVKACDQAIAQIIAQIGREQYRRAQDRVAQTVEAILTPDADA